MTRVRTSTKPLKSESGISVIEVLVAIAILTVGMLAILILFPAGLLTLQTAANSTNADRLGQEQLEKTNASALQLIGGIYANDNATANVNPATFIQSSGTQITSTGTAPNSGGLLTNGTDVDAFRSIQGETIRVPSLNVNSVSLYTVVASPLESGTVQVNGTPWLGISGDSDNAIGLGGFSDSNYSDPGAILTPGQPQYLIDYANGEICLSPEVSGASYAEPIAFTVTDATGATTTQYVTLPAPTTTGTVQPGQWIKLNQLFLTTSSTTPAVEPMAPWAKGSDIIVRNFQNVTGTSPTGYSPANWTGDPYQYQLFLPDYVSTAPTSTATPSANLGVIAFNPAACTMHGSNGQAIEAVLNYRTYDWHVISEDRQINSTNGTVKLSLINILANSAKDVLSDNKTKFIGLFSYSGAGITYNGTALDPDFIVLDMDKGNVLTEGTDYTVNFSGGAVSFINTAAANTPTDYSNDHLRLYYHPANDWAVALARAPLLYSMDMSTTDIAAMTPRLSSYVAPLGTTANTVSNTMPLTGTKIYFPLVDAGKQVDIRFQYVDAANMATTVSTVENLYTISSTSGSGYVDLADSTTQTNVVPTGAIIVEMSTPGMPFVIKGASLSAIVIWKDNGIWHNHTLSTVLPTTAQFSPTNTQ